MSKKLGYPLLHLTYIAVTATKKYLFCKKSFDIISNKYKFKNVKMT